MFFLEILDWAIRIFLGIAIKIISWFIDLKL